MRRLANFDLDSAVIVSSADGAMDDVIEVMRHGAIDSMREPSSPAEVTAAIAARSLTTPSRVTGSLGYFSGLFADAGAAFLLHVIAVLQVL